jgi:hypothetical protein
MQRELERGAGDRGERIDEATVVGEDAENWDVLDTLLMEHGQNARMEIEERQASVDDGDGGASRRTTKLSAEQL